MTPPTHRSFRRAIVLLLCLMLGLFTGNLFAQEESPAPCTLQSGGRERTYYLHVPSLLDRTKPAPVLCVFHGAGGNGLSDLGAYRWLADRHGFLLVGPDGLNKRWNAGNSDEIKATNQADDVAFVRDLLRAVAAEQQVDTNRLYAAGFSNGAALCHRLAAEMPDVLAAVAGAGATMSKVTLPLLKPGTSIAVQIMVGTEDGVFGRNGDLRGGTFLTAEETAKVWAKQNGCAEPVKHDAPVPFMRWPAKPPATAEVELWFVEGAGHTPSLGGKAWSTAEQQWRFLERHTRTARGLYTAWPFSAAEAKRRQTETAALFGWPVEKSVDLPGGVAVKFHLIPAGKFIIGSPSTEDGHEGDERQRPETISEPFYMMETQLTVEQYRALMQAEPSDVGDGSDPKVPAGIPFRDTVDKVLPALAKFAPVGWKVILPDHPRLEYAARAGVATMNPGGDQREDAAPFAWTRENSEQKVHPVGQKRANTWGLHDVIGNRWHWFWRAGAGYGNDSTKDHIVYGGTYRAESGGNGARLANIMISSGPEGARFALIRADSSVPKGHPETRPSTK